MSRPDQTRPDQTVTELTRVIASAPGKLILMGEHAVVYGRPALVVSVGLRTRVRLERRADGRVRLSLPDLGLERLTDWGGLAAAADQARRAWEAFSAGEGAGDLERLRSADRALVVATALAETARALGGSPPGLDVEVSSELPVGAGFGSSASVAVGVAGALAALLGGGRPEGNEPWKRLGGKRLGRKRLGREQAGRKQADGARADGARAAGGRADGGRAAGGRVGGARPGGLRVDGPLIEGAVLEVERRQHGRPSGVDHRTILRGGVQWAERDEGGELRCQTLALAPGALAPLRVFHTGTPAESTGRMVEAVRERFAGESGRLEAILDRMGEKVVGLRRALTAGPDPERIRALVSAYQRDLEALGVVPEAVRRTVRAIEATGAAAKVSGAGGLRGPEAGSLLAYDPEGVLEGAECVAGLERFDAELGVEGLEIESLS